MAHVMSEPSVAPLAGEPVGTPRWATIIAGRYMGADQAEAYGRRSGAPGELLARITPTIITAEASVAE